MPNEQRYLDENLSAYLAAKMRNNRLSKTNSKKYRAVLKRVVSDL